MQWDELWVDKYRPKTLDDVILSADIRKFFSELTTETIPNLMFSGPPGVGKTSLAKIIVNAILKCQYLYINGSDESSVDVVRTKIVGFAQTKSIDGKIKVIIIDEADGLSGSTVTGRTSAQQALRNTIEEYSTNCRFIFTCNYPDKIIDAIMSRAIHFKFALDYNDCLKQAARVLKAEGIIVSSTQIERLRQLVKAHFPDLRVILNALQMYSQNNNTLDIPDLANENKSYAMELLDMVIDQFDPMVIRKTVLERKVSFQPSYDTLMGAMVNVLLDGYNEKIVKQKRISMVLALTGALVEHNFVSDKEINFFSCIIKLCQLQEKS